MSLHDRDEKDGRAGHGEGHEEREKRVGKDRRKIFTITGRGPGRSFAIRRHTSHRSFPCAQRAGPGTLIRTLQRNRVLSGQNLPGSSSDLRMHEVPAVVQRCSLAV